MVAETLTPRLDGKKALLAANLSFPNFQKKFSARKNIYRKIGKKY